MMNFTAFLFSLFLISSTTLSLATRPDPRNGGDPNYNPGFGGYFGPPGNGFEVPDWRNFVGGYSPPGGGHSGNGIITPSFVCRERGSRCYKKKLTCPAKCFRSNSSSGKGYYGGGGGGGCTFDCKKCSADC